MLEVFQYTFMQRAFIAGIIVAIIAPVIGTFLVAKRYALLADTLAHVSLAGIAIGLLTGIYPLLSALGVSVIATVALERLRLRHKLSGETALAMFLSGSLALAVVCMRLVQGVSIDIISYLFGSITTVTATDIYLMLPLAIVILVMIIFWYQQLVYVVCDEEGAEVAGIPTKRINMLLLIMTAMTVVISIRIVGVLLIGALLVIPVATAQQIARSFKESILVGIGFSVLAVICGLFFSYYLNLPAGGTIVICALLLYGITAFVRKT